MEGSDVASAEPNRASTSSERSNAAAQLQAAVAGQLVLERSAASTSASDLAASTQPGGHSVVDAGSLSAAAVDIPSTAEPAAASMVSPPAPAQTPAPAMPSAPPAPPAVETAAATTTAAAVVVATAAPTAAAAADDWGDDDFGDFDAAPAAPAPQASSTPAATPATAAIASPAAADVAAGMQAKPPAATAAATAAGNDDRGDDEFGDFGDATSFARPNTSAAGTAPAAQPVVPAQAPPPAQPAAPAVAAAVPEGPDILQLSGRDFLAAVLEAWQVLGAPAVHAAALEQQPSAHHLQQLSAVQLQLPQIRQQQQQQQDSRVMSHCGLPLNTVSQQQQEQQQQQGEDLDSRLQWHGSVSEGRLVELLGMSQAVKRAMAALNKGQAAAGGGSASGPS